MSKNKEQKTNPAFENRGIYLLKTGGKLYVLDPTVDNWVIRQIAKGMHLFIRHQVNLYTSKEFGTIIARAGFNYLGVEKIKWNQKVQVGEKVN